MKLKLKNTKNDLILKRHPWIFSGAIDNIPDNIESGTIIELFDSDNNFIATGYFSSYSQIAIRILSFEKEKIDTDFFYKTIEKAYNLRKDYLLNDNTNSYRIVNGENDFLPGLVVDKYDKYLVLQFHTKGIEKWKTEILNALIKIFNPLGIFEKSDSSSRKIEQTDHQKIVLFGNIPDEILIKENGLTFIVNVKSGQKTGFFLDQRDKRKALQKYCKDKNVLNCFSYTGGFTVYALSFGAKNVTSVDSSALAIETAKKNITANNLDESSAEFIIDDAKNYLKKIKYNEFQVIILDPPAFIKDRHKKKEGIKGYRYINELALKSMSKNGILITCSCSSHLTETEFRYTIMEAAMRVKKSVQILESFSHSIDHPRLLPFMEGDYLKVFILKVCND